jgi:hypothetical protein
MAFKLVTSISVTFAYKGVKIGLFKASKGVSFLHFLRFHKIFLQYMSFLSC